MGAADPSPRKGTPSLPPGANVPGTRPAGSRAAILADHHLARPGADASDTQLATPARAVPERLLDGASPHRNGAMPAVSATSSPAELRALLAGP